MHGSLDTLRVPACSAAWRCCKPGAKVEGGKQQGLHDGLRGFFSPCNMRGMPVYLDHRVSTDQGH